VLVILSILYDELHFEVLLQFLYFFTKNIETEIFSDAMNFDIELIKNSPTKRGIIV
jgi:hypothetical protein